MWIPHTGFIVVSGASAETADGKSASISGQTQDQQNHEGRFLNSSWNISSVWLSTQYLHNQQIIYNTYCNTSLSLSLYIYTHTVHTYYIYMHLYTCVHTKPEKHPSKTSDNLQRLPVACTASWESACWSLTETRRGLHVTHKVESDSRTMLEAFEPKGRSAIVNG